MRYVIRGNHKQITECITHVEEQLALTVFACFVFLFHTLIGGCLNVCLYLVVFAMADHWQS